MDFDDQLRRYFGTADLAAVPEGALEAGFDRMTVDYGMEQDRGRRFALWTLMHVLGRAPDLDTLDDPRDRDAARDFMDMLDKLAQG